MNLGGPDKENNVWPLRSKKNAEANKTQNQWVYHNGESVKVRDLPSGIRVKAIEVVSASTAQKHGKENPLGTATGAGSDDGPVPIVWYKTANDYARITLTVKGKSTTYGIGDTMDLTGVNRKLKPPKTYSKYSNPLDVDWMIKKSDKREISTLVSANLRTYHDSYLKQNSKRATEVKETDGTKLAPRDLKKETQIDHVFDLSMGGLDRRDNLWSMRGDRNNYAAKNGTQFVAYCHNNKKLISSANCRRHSSKWRWVG